MNLRLSGDGIRFRITQAEMMRVLAGERIDETVPLAPPLRMALRLAEGAAPLSLDSGPGAVILRVSRKALAEIAARFPELDTLEGPGGVSLEVDLHSKRPA